MKILTDEDIADICSHFEYISGELYWTKHRCYRAKVGMKAGTINSRGYAVVSLKGDVYCIHHIVWAMHNGFWPVGIDHIDGNRSNNKIENLRVASHKENNMNVTWNKRNTSGYKGVSFDKDCNRWKAQIKFRGKKMSIGRYKTPEEAHSAYVKKAQELFGEFANEGKRPLYQIPEVK